MAGIRDNIITLSAWIWIVGSFSLVLILSLLAISLPMRFGEKRLSELLT